MAALDYDKAVAAQVIGGTWGGIAYGTADVPEELRATIYSAITRQVATMFAADQLSSEDRQKILTAAKAGIFLFPALTEKMAGDELLRVAFYRMMNDSGYWALKKVVLGQLKVAAEDAGMAAAKSAALWNAVSESMQWISGAKAKAVLDEHLTQIAKDVAKLNSVLTEAKKTLTPARYAKVRAEAAPVADKISYLNTILPGVSAEVGWTGLGVFPVALVAVGVVIVVVAALATYIGVQVLNAYNMNNKMLDEQRKEEIAAAGKKADAAIKAAESKYASDVATYNAQESSGKITATQSAAMKAAAAAERDAAIAAARSGQALDIEEAGKRADAGKTGPGQEVGAALSGMMTPIAIAAAVAAIAIFAVPKLLAKR